MRINKKVEDLAPSGIRAFFELVLNMKDCISLGVGEPDFVTPWSVRESAIFSIEKGYTSYTSNKGMYELRRDISRYLENKYDLRYDPDGEILVTVGVSEAFDLALRALINPRDKVLIPEPCYVSYAPITALCGGIPVHIKTGPKNDFKVDPEDILRCSDKNTRAIILNYPNNPTGASYTKKELKRIADAALKKDLYVISDEIYCELTYDFKHTPLSGLPRMKERTIYLNGFSKAYAMTGWRIGYACGPGKVIAAMTKIHQYTMLCAPIVSQLAAREAIKSADRPAQEMKREYRRRREFLVGSLNEMGMACHMPEGAFYTFPSIKKVTKLGSVEFAKKLLKQQKVAVVPGCAFGLSGEGYVRMAYAANFEDIKEAVIRIKKFLTRNR
ncbi:aminotransferase class I/II-fold pyridoxal phosphate-dependent enzyme [Candidatus Omnitrophota bacterium]